VGTKAVNALSESFIVQIFRDGRCKKAEFCREFSLKSTKKQRLQKKMVQRLFSTPIQKFLRIIAIYQPTWMKKLELRLFDTGLTLIMNGKPYSSSNGLLDLLQKRVDENIRYDVIHFKDKDIEVAFTHGNQYGEHYYSFVNGQHTTQGGTHQAAFREGIVKGARDHFKKDLDPADIRNCIIGAISIRIQEPVFESQTKTKLGSTSTAPNGPALRSWIVDFVSKEFDNYLFKNPDTEKKLLDRITQNERERKEIAGIKKLANERAKKANLHNKKLRDCKVHLTEVKVLFTKRP
jgi:topoisomerase-4 subunit B